MLLVCARPRVYTYIFYRLGPLTKINKPLISSYTRQVIEPHLAIHPLRRKGAAVTQPLESDPQERAVAARVAVQCP